jgi:hypothetical protein
MPRHDRKTLITLDIVWASEAAVRRGVSDRNRLGSNETTRRRAG